MRLFLPQNLGPDESTTPPFLSDREEDTRVALVRESSLFVKDGKQRLPTPEKTAIMALSSSFEKRRLGKQQQILSEITQRCREQEVNDLSSRITAKCDLNTHVRGPHMSPARDNPFYLTTTAANVQHRGSKHRLSDISLGGSNDSGQLSPDGTKRVNNEKAYKFFPARRIIRQQTKINSLSPNLPKVNAVRKYNHHNDPFDTMSRSPRYTYQAHLQQQQLQQQGLHDDVPEVRFPKHINPANFVHAKVDPLAPLQLPRLSMVDAAYQDRIESYFSSAKLMSMPRTKTLLDNGSVSGRSYKSGFDVFGLSNNRGPPKSSTTTAGGKSNARSDRSEHGLMHIPFQHDHEDHHSLESIGRAYGQSVENLSG